MTSTVYVQYADATESTIASFFGCPQDPAIYPNQAQIPTSDARYKAFVDTLPASVSANMPAAQ